MPKKTAVSTPEGRPLSLDRLSIQLEEIRDELSLLGSLLDYAARDGRNGSEDWAITPEDCGTLSATLNRLSDAVNDMVAEIGNAQPSSVVQR